MKKLIFVAGLSMLFAGSVLAQTYSPPKCETGYTLQEDGVSNKFRCQKQGTIKEYKSGTCSGIYSKVTNTQHPGCKQNNAGDYHCCFATVMGTPNYQPLGCELGWTLSKSESVLTKTCSKNVTTYLYKKPTF